MARPTRVAALIAATTLTIAACGGTTNQAEPAADAAGTATAAVAGPSTAASPLPAVEVLDVTSGERVQLAGYLPAAKPTLVWMWAPH